MGDLPDVRLLGANCMLFGVYQDWVHQNPEDNLDGGIKEDGKWQARWKTRLYANTTLRCADQKSREDICWNNLCGAQRGMR